MCPHCRQNAPIVYRGINAYCTACGAPRMPLAGKSVNLAGQPEKVGGTITRVFGWTVLAAGWLLALVFAGIIMLLGGSWGALAIGGPIALITTLVAWALLRGGKELKKSGDDTELATKNQAIFALANTHGGVLRAMTVAQALQVSLTEGDDILTKLAKEHPDYVSVDIDDNGNVLYRFTGNPRGYSMAPGVMAPNAVPPHVRVAVPNVRVAQRQDAQAEPLEADVLEEAGESLRQKAR